MIVYGSKAKLLATETQPESCVNCGTTNSVQLALLQRYFHLFWIPMFPFNKVGVSQCAHCQQVVKEKDLTTSSKLALQDLKRNNKIPKWMFVGTALIVLVVIMSAFEGIKRAKQNAALILAPKAGDIFEIKTKDLNYTLYKVSSVNGDSVFVQPNLYETDRSSGISSIKSKGDAAFAEEESLIMKPELKQMLDKGDIRDIDRK